MGLLDKAKQQAQDLKGKVEGKVEDVQAKRKVDDLLADLGRYAYASRTSRPLADEEPATEKIVAELQALESAGATVLRT